MIKNTSVIFLLSLIANSGFAEEPISEYSYLIVNSFPHDHGAFTQGFVYKDGYFYESTGRRTESTLRQIDIETGAVVRSVALPSEFFGEGLTVFDNQLVQLTWQSYTGLVYSLPDLALIQEFYYTTEGWGLTTDGETLIMSDGSATLYFLDPYNYAILDTIEVRDKSGTVRHLNELEYVNGQIYANILSSNRIACIDPSTGDITAWIDLNGILRAARVSNQVDVLNGIAYDAAGDRLFVTGKLWPVVFEIQLIPVRK